MNGNVGVVLDKSKVREVIEALEARRGFSQGQVGVEQAINRICQLQRPPENLDDVALTVCCPYCGYNPGNPCERAGVAVSPHPSRLALALGRGLSA